ncbi:uncharacterized protein SCHCODRAFT_02522026 [Schizophyllum commune H4-8]|uniref:Uncharacterized protein n=1 Tax=Schizophyllum commune (strain H4-8 / FGSC 9210) TaxID=578458 RepID=D8QL90_SCHCM|nr:uncharacterized protein SCHCODRAFT_02522026 [Schizophyllum commune H4-8]KAI5884798.1 hypothetical protein SCHCODRAFT_02522026 [Schizophyllum commune H4-8]
MTPPDDYPSLKAAATHLVEASREEQRKLVDEHWDVITALARWSPEAPDKELYESMSRLIESTWFASFKDRQRAADVETTDGGEGNTESEATTEATLESDSPWDAMDIPALIESVTMVADSLEQLNKYLDIAPNFIDAANHLIDHLDAAEAAEVAFTRPGVRTAHIDPSLNTPMKYGASLHNTAPLSRSSTPASASLQGCPDMPSRTPSVERTQSGSATGPSCSPSPAPSSVADAKARSLSCERENT